MRAGVENYMKKGKEMFTPQNVDLNVNPNPEYVQEERTEYKRINEEKVPTWTPDNLLNALKTVGYPFDPKDGYSVVRQKDKELLVNILSDKLFTWEKEGKITYDKIAEIIHVLVERPIGSDGGLLCELRALGRAQPVIDFLAKFIPLIEKDERYYDLFELMLTAQIFVNKKFPLGATFYFSGDSVKNEYIDKVLNKLPAVYKERLMKNTYHYYDEDSDRTYCYALNGRIVSVD